MSIDHEGYGVIVPILNHVDVQSYIDKVRNRLQYVALTDVLGSSWCVNNTFCPGLVCSILLEHDRMLFDTEVILHGAVQGITQGLSISQLYDTYMEDITTYLEGSDVFDVYVFDNEVHEYLRLTVEMCSAIHANIVRLLYRTLYNVVHSIIKYMNNERLTGTWVVLELSNRKDSVYVKFTDKSPYTNDFVFLIGHPLVVESGINLASCTRVSRGDYCDIRILVDKLMIDCDLKLSEIDGVVRDLNEIISDLILDRSIPF